MMTVKSSRINRGCTVPKMRSQVNGEQLLQRKYQGEPQGLKAKTRPMFKGLRTEKPGARLKTTERHTQTRLRPETLRSGGEGYYHDVQRDPKGAMRVYFQNVSGLPTDKAALRTVFHALGTFKASYYGLQETHVNSTNHERVAQISSACMESLNKRPTLQSNTTHFVQSQYQPGGLATVMCRSLSSKSNRVRKDPTSIVQTSSVITEKGELRIINAYLPPRSKGPLSTYVQTMNTIKRLDLQPRHLSVREYFYTMLEKEIQEAVDDGAKIIIGGDFNETHGERSEMTKRLEHASLVNVTSPGGEGAPPSSRRPGSRVIDHVWVSNDLLPVLTAFGYLPFGLGVWSDHRGLFVDLKMSKVENPSVPCSVQRKLDSKNCRSVERYLKRVNALVLVHSIERNIAKLDECLEFGEEQAAALQRIDATFTIIQLTAEAELHQQKTADWFSSSLHKLKMERHYWRRLLRLKGTTDHFTLAQIFEGHLVDNVGLPRKAILDRLWKVGNKIKEARERSVDLREKMLDEIARKTQGVYALGDSQVRGNVKAMRNAEAMKRKFARLRKLKHPREATGARVKVPSTGTVREMWRKLKVERVKPKGIEWREIDTEEEVEEHLLQWCVLHFGQSRDTPLASRDWEERLGPEQAEEVIEALRTGDFRPPEGSPPEMKEFFEAARTADNRPEVPSQLTFQNFLEFCRKQDERKASSPSGVHYGHFKALAWDERLLRIKFKVMHLAYKNGVILERWKKVWEVLLKKDRNNNYIHRFRNITLVEGDVQFLMKCLWSKRLMTTITPFLDKQQNALKGRVTQSSVLSHRVALDLMFITGERSIVIENDAVNCYDRILRIVAILALALAGMPFLALMFFQAFLAEARHHLILGGKPTTRCFADSRTTPIEGSGQGTGWSPPTWFMIAEIILRALRANQPGMLLISPAGETTDFRAAEKHVDDSRQTVNETGVLHYNKENKTNLTLEEATNQASQAFERYLSLTGGKLAIEKTMYHALYPDIHGPRMRYMGKAETRVKIEITENFSTVRQRLQQYEADEAHKLLGVYTDPSSTNTAQIEYMRNQTREWGTRMRKSTLPSALKLLSYKMELLPQVQYPLPAVSLSERQLQHIMRPAYPSMKHALGLCEKTGTESIFYPTQFGGYGMTDLHLESLVHQTKFMIQHLRNGDSVGRRIMILMNTHQLESGLSTPFERFDLGQIECYMTDSIILELLKGLHALNATIRMKHWVPQRGEATIMEGLIEARVTPEYLKIANRCRMWARVHSIQDLALCNGKTMHPGYADGKRVRGSRWQWPRWVPPESWRRDWADLLNTHIRRQFPLRDRAKESHQVYEYTADDSGEFVRAEEATYRVASRRRKPRLARLEEDPGRVYTRVCDVWPPAGERYLLASSKIRRQDKQSKEKQMTFEEVLLMAEPGLSEYMRDMPTSAADCEALLDRIENGDLVLGSDGSADHSNLATFSVTLASTDLTTIHTSSHEAKGKPCDSGRAELFGVLTLSLYVKTLTKHHGVEVRSPIPLYCDNKETVEFAATRWVGTTPRWADQRNVDLKMLLKELLSDDPNLIQVYHVPAHQDNACEFDDLDLPAKLNVICDRACSAYLRELRKKRTRQRPMTALKTNVVTLEVEGSIVTEEFKRVLERQKYSRSVAKALGMSRDVFASIDWESHERALRREGGQSLRKLLWKHHPTRQRLYAQKRYPSPICPLCEEVDDDEHFLRCVRVNESPECQALETKLRHRAHGKGMPDHLIDTITETMKGVEKSPRRQRRERRKPYTAQGIIGWEHFRKGRLAMDWGTGGEEKNSDRTPAAFQTELASLVLRWLREKWLVRCVLVHKTEENAEKVRMITECKKLWETRKSARVLAKDRGLFEEKCAPSRHHSIDYLRAWLETRALAIEEYNQYAPSGRQGSILKWLRSTR